MAYWFPDNSVIVNFGRIDRLELLKGRLRSSGRITQAVSVEITNSAAWVPALATIDRAEWFGDAIEVDDDNGAVENIRVHQFGGDRYAPKEHLGESETLYVIRNIAEYRDSTWITEDKDAYQFGKRNDITTMNTLDLFKELVAFGEVTKEEAFALMLRLDGMDRLFQCPKTPADFD